MKRLIEQIKIQVNDKIYLKDPDTSELGKKIISQSIFMIDKMGFESFTFGKLSKEIDSTESSVYRYFESKHKLLLYVISWYWGWLEYQLVFSTINIISPEEKLKAAIEVLAKDIDKKEKFNHIQLGILSRIVISESAKAYLVKGVDDANKAGFYMSYKRMIDRVSDMVLEINPKYTNAHTLISTIVEGVNHQKYFADHLPSLTDIKHDNRKLVDFFNHLALTTIKNK